MFGNNPLLMIALASVAAYVVGKLFVRGDSAVEERRRGALTLLVDAEKAGLGFLAPLLQDYAVGDYSGVVKEVGKLRDGLHDPERRRLALQTFLAKQFELHAADPDGRAAIEALVLKYVPDEDILAFADKVREAKAKEVTADATTS